MDVQYYSVNNCYVIKEATILSVITNISHHFVFQNTTAWKELSARDRKTARFICEEVGCIHYSCGVDVFQDFLETVPKEAMIIMNGHVKKKILKALLPQNRVVDLKVPFYSLTAVEKCAFPSYHTQCSLTNCFKIKNFL